MPDRPHRASPRAIAALVTGAAVALIGPGLAPWMGAAALAVRARGGQPAPGPSSRPAPPRTGMKKGQTYVTAPGETLGSVARKIFGDVSAWKRLGRANVHLFRDVPLPPGTRLVIPPPRGPVPTPSATPAPTPAPTPSATASPALPTPEPFPSIGPAGSETPDESAPSHQSAFAGFHMGYAQRVIAETFQGDTPGSPVVNAAFQVPEFYLTWGPRFGAGDWGLDLGASTWSPYSVTGTGGQPYRRNETWLNVGLAKDFAVGPVDASLAGGVFARLVQVNGGAATSSYFASNAVFNGPYAQLSGALPIWGPVSLEGELWVLPVVFVAENAGATNPGPLIATGATSGIVLTYNRITGRLAYRYQSWVQYANGPFQLISGPEAELALHF